MPYPPRATRVAFQDEAMLQFGGEMFWCATRNLSVTGMAMICSTPIPVAQPILLGFNLDPASDSESVQAVVVRAQNSHQGCFLGVQFKDMDDALLARLLRYVNEHSQS